MSKTAISLFIGCMIFLLPINGLNYHEKHRLQVHYSVPSGFMNDPNGLIFEDGYYHLYFQYDPDAMTNTNCHWGHARSIDLIHWENLPIAIYPYEKGMIFSGCCVKDKNNVTGLGSNLPGKDVEPLIAIYSLHNVTSNSQDQGLSYSHDRGLTWTYYDGNPIIPNPGVSNDFRDPNIIERYGKFYMSLAVFDRVTFYSSDNLIKWDFVSDFGVDPDEGEKEGVWECPALFTLKDEQSNEHDILIVSENVPKQGSAMQYFIGKFNGTHYNTYDKSRQLWLEYGHDNFAAVPYHNDPLGRLIIIGWMANWNYASDVPTSTWLGQMTIPREVTLRNVDGRIHLVQRPIDEFNSIIDRSRQWSLSTPYYMFGSQNLNLTSQMTFKTGSMLTLDYDINIENVLKGDIALKFSNNLGEFVLFHYNVSSDTYVFDRRNSGNVTFSEDFITRIPTAKRISTGNRLSGQIILDKSAIEIFADDGIMVFTALFFPTEPFENIDFIFDVEDTEKTVTVEKLSVSALKSIWM
ncbi:uncharacterized protein LOC116340313 [Contarinia nasturtii]|uniref:uncharacterized protein LOC116340313 n=1 Tax=Contarinia nasturtii TaxID=265458 RepID=UPI0012D4B3EE|nr:uncharacterized protein LOC116340313 [Contarinia nasturtii]